MWNPLNRQETPEDRQARLQRVLKSSKRYEGLWLNPDFQYYRKHIVLGRLRDLKKMIVVCDVDKQKGIDRAIRLIIRYQELQKEIKEFITMQIQIGRSARKQLKKE